MNQPRIEGREGLYMLLNQHAHTALNGQPIFEAHGEADFRHVTPLEVSPLSTPLPQGLTIQQLADLAGVSKHPASLEALHNFIEEDSLNTLDDHATSLLLSEASDEIIDYLEAEPSNVVLTVGKLLTRVATEEQDGGRIMLVELAKPGEEHASVSMLNVRREPYGQQGETAALFVNNGSEFVHGNVVPLDTHISAAHTAVREMFGPESAAMLLLSSNDEEGVDVEAELEAIRQTVQGIYPPEEVEVVFDLIRGAFEPVEDTEPEEARLRRLIAFTISMAQ